MLASRNPLAVDARLLTRQKEKQPKAQTFGWRGRNHPWADTDSGRRQSRSLRQPSTRPVSWLEPTFAGTNPCTKGTRYSAGGHRRRVPFTPKGLLAIRSRRCGQTARRPFDANGITPDQSEPCGDDSSMNCLLATRPRAVRRAHRCRRKGVPGVPRRVRGALRRRDWRTNSCQCRVSSPWAMTGVVVCGLRRAGCRRNRWARCPCSRDSGCTTRRRRSCRCAGGWTPRIPGRPAPRAA